MKTVSEEELCEFVEISHYKQWCLLAWDQVCVCVWE